jgi:hypothetical protein
LRGKEECDHARRLSARWMGGKVNSTMDVRRRRL